MTVTCLATMIPLAANISPNQRWSFLEANADEDHLHFFCLDEMNLAHVEYYFSQFLSAMEEERPSDRRITLIGKEYSRC